MDLLILIIIVTVFAIQAFFVLLIMSGRLKKYSLALMLGFFIAWRTKRGRKFIDWLARAKRFWMYYGDFCIAMVAVSAVIMSVLLVWSALLVTAIPQDRKPSPQMLIGMPGINPIIPIWYGILALAVAIIFHEFAHGTLCRVAKIRLKSLGLLFVIVPIGAFAEPDEKQLNKAERRKRARVYAVGPATNLFIALVCVLIFAVSMMGSLKAKEDGVMVTGFSKDSQIYSYGNELGLVIQELNGTKMRTADDFNGYAAPPPASKITVSVYYKGKHDNISLTSGVLLIYVDSGAPAGKASLEPGMMLRSIKNYEIRNANDFADAMKNTSASETVNVTIYLKDGGAYNKTSTRSITLGNKYDYTKADGDRGKGYLGVSAAYLGVYVDSVDYVSTALAHPFKDAKGFGDYVNGMRFYIALPMYKLSPFPEPLTDIYEPTGFWGAIPADSFWILANAFYWMFWLNLMVGLTNALPAVPFDGGYIFKDFVDYSVEKTRPKMDAKKREKIVSRITIGVSLVFVGLIIWLFVGSLI